VITNTLRLPNRGGGPIPASLTSAARIAPRAGDLLSKGKPLLEQELTVSCSLPRGGGVIVRRVLGFLASDRGLLLIVVLLGVAWFAGLLWL
jgi:hypothetical protein